jgi:hypothetical protein
MTAVERLACNELQPPPSCPQCGRAPMLIVEVVIKSCEDVAALQKLKEAEKTA